MESECHSLKSDGEALLKRADSAVSEAESFKAESKRRMQDLQSACDDKESSIEALKTEKAKAEESLAETQHALSRMKEARDDAEAWQSMNYDEKEALLAERYRIVHELNTLAMRKSDLENFVSDQSMQLRHKDEARAALEEDLRKERESSAAVEHQRDEARNKVHELESEVKEEQRRRKELHEDLEGMKEMKAKEEQRLLDSYRELERMHAIEKSRQEYSEKELTEQLDVTDRQLMETEDALRKTQSALESEKAQKENLNIDLRRKNEQAMEKIKREAEEKAEQLRRERDSNIDELKNAQERVLGLEGELEEQKKQFATLKGKKTQLEQEKEQLEYTSAQNESKLQEEQSKRQDELAAKDRKMSEANAAMETIESAINDLCRQLLEGTEASFHRFYQYEPMESALQSLQNAIAQKQPPVRLTCINAIHYNCACTTPPHACMPCCRPWSITAAALTHLTIAWRIRRSMQHSQNLCRKICL